MPTVTIKIAGELNSDIAELTVRTEPVVEDPEAWKKCGALVLASRILAQVTDPNGWQESQIPVQKSPKEVH